jgi:phage terminase small subunit
MPRKSAAALATAVRVDGKSTRLQPPTGLGASETELFRSLVSANDPSHFRPSDLPLLARYVEACVLAERAAAEMRKTGPVIDGRASPWIVIQEKSVRAMTALSMRLRLSPQSRLDPKTAARRQGQPASPYEDERHE